jgi:hypothetical protein
VFFRVVGGFFYIFCAKGKAGAERESGREIKGK